MVLLQLVSGIYKFLPYIGNNRALQSDPKFQKIAIIKRKTRRY